MFIQLSITQFFILFFSFWDEKETWITLESPMPLTYLELFVAIEIALGLTGRPHEIWIQAIIGQPKTLSPWKNNVYSAHTHLQ